MKYLLALLIAPCVALAQGTPGKGFVINATVQGLNDKEVVTITDVNNPKDTLARAAVKQGAFQLTGKMREPNLVNLNLGSEQKRINVFMGNEAIQISGDLSDLAHISITGSPTHDDFMEFQQVFNPLFQRLNELNAIVQQGNNSRNDSLMRIYNTHLNQIQQNIDSFIVVKRSSPLAAFTILVTSELSQDPTLLEQRYGVLDPGQQTAFFGRILKSQVDDTKVGTVGSRAISFTQNDTVGNPISLDAFRGQYVLIDFWASWCRPCRMENPNVVNAFHKFKDKKFTVLGVSLDRSKDDWLRAIKDDRLAWTHVSDLKFWNNEVAQRYRVQSIPQNFLVDPNGIIVAKNLRGNELISRLCQILGCE